MNRIKLFPILLSIGFAGLIALPANAQETDKIDAQPARNARQRIPRRPNLLGELGLSPVQIDQIKQINQNRKPQIEEAQRRLREANRALDAAIYADTANASEVNSRLSDFQAAQAEVARIRFTSELSIRNVLTPEQLGRFRELRQRFASRRQNAQERRVERRSQRRNPGPVPPGRTSPEF